MQVGIYSARSDQSRYLWFQIKSKYVCVCVCVYFVFSNTVLHDRVKPPEIIQVMAVWRRSTRRQVRLSPRVCSQVSPWYTDYWYIYWCIIIQVPTIPTLSVSYHITTTLSNFDIFHEILKTKNRDWQFRLKSNK